jgi:hypothetical protein
MDFAHPFAGVIASVSLSWPPGHGVWSFYEFSIALKNLSSTNLAMDGFSKAQTSANRRKIACIDSK